MNGLSGVNGNGKQLRTGAGICAVYAADGAASGQPMLALCTDERKVLETVMEKTFASVVAVPFIVVLLVLLWAIRKDEE